MSTHLQEDQLKRSGVDTEALDASITNIRNLFTAALSGKEEIRAEYERRMAELRESNEELEKAIEEELKEKELALYVLAVTDILNSNSEILVLGEKSSVVEKAFDKKLENNRAFLEGVVSRKNQLLPNIDKNILKYKCLSNKLFLYKKTISKLI